MSMFEISAKRNWRSVCIILLVFLLFVTTFLFAALQQQFTKDNPDISMTINASFLWLLLFMLFLGARFRYRQEKKKDSNRIKPN